MKLFLGALLFLGLTACTTPATDSKPSPESRTPAATLDITGTFLGEGLFYKRTSGIRQPAMRLYVDRAENENAYYGVLIEYDRLINMSLPYMATQKAPALNSIVGYLDKITTRIAAYKIVSGKESGTYEFYYLTAKNGQIQAAQNPSLLLRLSSKATEKMPLIGAEITGLSDGKVIFPHSSVPGQKGLIKSLADALIVSELNLAHIIYSAGKLKSTWRGNWNDLEGSYLSEYGRFKDGVLELSSDSRGQKMQFFKTNKTKAKYFTNPKSASIEGKFRVVEPIRKMYVLVPESGRVTTASDKEMTSRIGLFLDVFDASAPEAGGHMVTELAFTSTEDSEDFMMYYQHPEHVKNVGVEPK